MDGLAHGFSPTLQLGVQRTLRQPIDCAGVGLHTGRRVTLRLLPGGTGSGIVIRRTDLVEADGRAVEIPARFDHVVDTRLCTVLALPGRPETRTGTIEHVMAALAGAAITNATIEIDGPEAPILDGSAEPFCFLIACAGTTEQPAAAPVIEVLRTVRVAEGEAFAELRPARPDGTRSDGARPDGARSEGAPSGGALLQASVSIAFAAPAIGREALSLAITPASFRDELARARTFTQMDEVEQLHAAGLALGGSLDNAVVVDGDRVLNPEGLRMPDEFVRHKLLDVVGDLGLAGAPLRARLVAHRPGHGLNNRLLRALFAERANWRWIGTPAVPGGTAGLPGWQEARLPVAAAPL